MYFEHVPFASGMFNNFIYMIFSIKVSNKKLESARTAYKLKEAKHFNKEL